MMMAKMTIIEQIKSLLLGSNRILLLCHITPDGDCLGSLLALGRALKKLGKEVFMYCEDEIPSFLEYMIETGELQSNQAVATNFDVAVALDSGDSKRLGELGLELYLGTKKKINIDHHASNPGYGDLNWVEPNKAATGEMVLQLIDSLGIPLDLSLGIPLYTAIFTDTGGFRHSNTTSETLKIASRLVELGVDPAAISREIYENKPLNYFKLLSSAFNRFTIDGRICYTWVKIKEIEELGLDYGAAEELTTFTKMMKDIDVAIVFKEKDENYIKVSLRSQSDYNVAKLAEKFGGGGHEKAAGLIIKDSLEIAIKQVLNAAKEVQ